MNIEISGDVVSGCHILGKKDFKYEKSDLGPYFF